MAIESETPALEVQRLSKFFGKGAQRTCVLDEISFQVAPGEVIGVAGESGCGKSTLLRIITGLTPASSGDIHLFGAQLGVSREKQIFAQLQMVFQDPYDSLPPRKTIGAILREPLKIHAIEDQENKVANMLERVGLSQDHFFRYPHQLSGGQRQRVSIARALILEPRVLLLDEPTSALDVSIQAQILTLLEQLKQQFDLTFMIVSHDLAILSRMAQRILVLDLGKIVEEVTPQALLDRTVSHPLTLSLLHARDWRRATGD